jgi:tetratricopeptide (TPR) repeat protein
LESLVKSNSIKNLEKEKQARIYYWLAMLTTYKKDWQQNIDYLNQAVFLDKKDEYQEFLSDLNNLILVQNAYKDNDHEKVKNLAKTYESKEEKHAFHEKFYLSEVFYYLGQIACQDLNFNLAEKYWRQAIEINPYDEKIYLNLTTLYEESGKDNQAKRILEKCVSIDKYKQKCQEKLLKYQEFIKN